MNKWQRFGRFMRRLMWFVVVLLVAFITSQMIHELGHLITIEWFGGKGEINLEYILLPVSVAVVETPDYLLFTYLSGGVFAAIFPWLFLWYVSWRTPERGDVWIEAISFSVILTHILYAPTEWGLYSRNIAVHTIGQYVAMGAAQLIFFALYIWKIVYWLDGRYGTPGRKQVRKEG